MRSDETDGGAGATADPFAQIHAAVAAVADIDVAALPTAALADLVRDLERAARHVAAVQADVHAHIHHGGRYRDDAFWSAKAMVRHLGQLSDPEATHRDRVARALCDLPHTRAAYLAGEIGDCQVRRLARTWANPRVRDLLPGAEAHLVDLARTQPYRWFADAVTIWERAADQDGTIDADQIDETAHLRRREHHHGGDGTWDLHARFRSANGALLKEIFDHFLAAELRADWDHARDLHGDDATDAHLPRTHTQRCADALKAIFLQGASAPPGSKEPRLTINLVIDHDEYLRQVAILAGETPPERVSDRIARSYTHNGTWIDPWDIASMTIGADLRRLVIGADSTTVDLGHRTRCFTGSARDAVMLRHPECVWAGCHTPTTRCQADHALAHTHGGPTNAGNGQPLCGRHNRHKHQHHYTVWRDPTGTWHTQRPDGTHV